jgi:LAO/AO transport system kinase
LERYVEGVLKGDRMLLARAITVVESNLPSDGELAAHLLDALLPHTGRSLRVGITGVPGVGKSTFIDALGMYLIRDRGEGPAAEAERVGRELAEKILDAGGRAILAEVYQSGGPK